MIKAEQVPKSVIAAAYHAYWHETPNAGFAEAIAAAINAWPGMLHETDWAGPDDPPGIVLPLPQEPAFSTGHCEHHKAPGGCQLHNLHCGYPDCDRRPK